MKQIILSGAAIFLLLVSFASTTVANPLAGSFSLGVAFPVDSSNEHMYSGGFIFGAGIGFHTKMYWTVFLSIENSSLTPPDIVTMSGSGNERNGGQLNITMIGPEFVFDRLRARRHTHFPVSAGLGFVRFSTSDWNNWNKNGYYISVGTGLQFGASRSGNIFLHLRAVHFLEEKDPSWLIPITAGIRF